MGKLLKVKNLWFGGQTHEISRSKGLFWQSRQSVCVCLFQWAVVICHSRIAVNCWAIFGPLLVHSWPGYFWLCVRELRGPLLAQYWSNLGPAILELVFEN